MFWLAVLEERCGELLSPFKRLRIFGSHNFEKVDETLSCVLVCFYLSKERLEFRLNFGALTGAI